MPVRPLLCARNARAAQVPATALEGGDHLPVWKAALAIHVYQLDEDGGAAEMAEGDEQTVALQQWLLPSRDFEGLWERYDAGGGRRTERAHACVHARWTRLNVA